MICFAIFCVVIKNDITQKDQKDRKRKQTIMGSTPIHTLTYLTRANSTSQHQNGHQRERRTDQHKSSRGVCRHNCAGRHAGLIARSPGRSSGRSLTPFDSGVAGNHTVSGSCSVTADGLCIPVLLRGSTGRGAVPRPRGVAGHKQLKDIPTDGGGYPAGRGSQDQLPV